MLVSAIYAHAQRKSRMEKLKASIKFSVVRSLQSVSRHCSNQLITSTLLIRHVNSYYLLLFLYFANYRYYRMEQPTRSGHFSILQSSHQLRIFFFQVTVVVWRKSMRLCLRLLSKKVLQKMNMRSPSQWFALSRQQ